MRHTSYLEINLDMLGQNFSSIQELAPKSTVLPMVKANAYGNGLVPISRYLVQEHGVKNLGCASLGEAIEIFEECPELETNIQVFSDSEVLNSKAREAYSAFNITPVIHRTLELDLFLKDEAFKKVPLSLKLNTGMNRLGLTWDELEPYLPRLKSRGIDHLLTHFGCSYYELKDGDRTSRQLAEFNRMRDGIKNAGVEIRGSSVSNSGAIEQGIGVEETFVRPGLMLYGPYSVSPERWKGYQISKLVTKAIKTSLLKKGTPFGYGVNVLPEDAFLVVVPLGYGDGITTFTSGVELTVKGFKAKVVGRVNMDMAFLAFDPSVQGKIKDEEEIEIWNHDNKVISDIADQMKTHAYQMMCAISGRIPRIYKVK